MQQLKIKRTANSNLQNEINISVIFNFLRTKGASYRAQISKDLSISAPAVSRAVEHLIKKGYVLERGRIKTEYGKNASKVMVNPNIGFIVAVDMLKERVRIAVTDFSGKIRVLYSSFSMTGSRNLQEDLIREIKNISDKYIHTIKKDARIKAICLGIPASTNLKTGKINAVLYESLEKFDLKTLLSEAFSVPVYVENIANLSAIGESSCGRGKDYKEIVFLEISNGIGAGIISNNTLHRGSSGNAGEIGYSLIDKDDLDSFRRRKGSLERVASMDTIVSDMKKELRFGEESILGNNPEIIEKIDAASIFNAAVKKDRLAQRIIEKAVKHIAICATNLILTIDPEIIFIGGDLYHMPEAEFLFIEPLKNYVRNVLPFEPPVIELSSLGEDAGIIGASYLAVETLLTGKYPYRIE